MWYRKLQSFDEGGTILKDKREFQIAMVLTGLVGVNFFYLLDIFFSGLHRVLFRSENQILIDWTSAILVILANIVALVGLFYLVRPRAVESTRLQGDRV